MVRPPSVKDFLREVRKTASRFVSIILLLVLAVAFFSGLRATQPDMRHTADAYMDRQHMYDVRVQSTLGLTREDITAIGETEGVIQVAGMYRFDAVAASQKQDIVVSLQTFGSSGMNSPEVLNGRLPVSSDECAAEEKLLSLMGLGLGGTFDIKEIQSGFEDAVPNRTLTIVGVVRSPLYISKVQRGSSPLGSGSVGAFAVIPERAVTLDYYTEADIAVDGAARETAYTQTYGDKVSAVVERLDTLSQTRAPGRYNELAGKADRELRDAQTELDSKKEELEESKKQLNIAKADYAAGLKELSDQKAKADSELQKARDQLEASERQIEQGYRDLDSAQKELDAQKASGEAQLEAALADLSSKQASLNDATDAYNAARAQLEAQLAPWSALPESIRQTMPDKAAQLDAAQKQLDLQKQQLDTQQAALTASLEQLSGQKAAAEQQTEAAQQEIDTGRTELEASQQRLETGRREYEGRKAEAEKKIADAGAELRDAEVKITDAETTLRDGETKITQADTDLKDAKKKLADIPEGKWYLEDRSGNIGYGNYGDDADRMGALGGIFPIIFFAVAALVALTTMTRMVDEKRLEIGTYKALGHSPMTTAGKFIYYSILATVLGVAGGLVIGFLLFPQFIFKAYSILYDLPPLHTLFYPGICIAASATAILCTVGATVFASFSALRETPASLLRPKAPDPGKRVLFEYITPLWKKLSFFAKVSIRNIFRYKKRLIMTLLGIAGCTALIVTGFGLRDSITDITDLQFGVIFNYDLLAYLSDKDGEDKASEVLASGSGVSDWLFVRSVTADVSTAAGTVDGHILVPDDPGRLEGFIRLAHRSDGSPADLTDSGAVITEKMSELLGLRIEDAFTVDFGGKHTVKVADIVENYVYHYVYMTPAYYASVFGGNEDVNQALINLSNDTEETAAMVSSDLLKTGDVAYVSHFTTIARSFRDSMNSINDVVIIILVSAALLAFVVLFNLTNINITERTRELATIKVLGFYDREVSWYIIRENTVLTAAGIMLGLVGGKFLHAWLVRTVELSFVMFGRDAKPVSYLFAGGLTFLFALLVNMLGQRRIKRINMVESLKTNE